MIFDYSANTLNVNGITYDLDAVRSYLLKNHATLCVNHFLKAIRIKGKTVFTYDWSSIFEVAEESNILNEFLAK